MLRWGILTGLAKPHWIERLPFLAHVVIKCLGNPDAIQTIVILITTSLLLLIGCILTSRFDNFVVM